MSVTVGKFRAKAGRSVMLSESSSSEKTNLLDLVLINKEEPDLSTSRLMGARS